MSVSPLLAMLRFSADRLFEALVAAPSAKRGLVVEVGSFDGQQAKMAYDKGHQLLVLEPSPVNFPKVRTRLRRGIESGEGRLVLLQVAASARNGSAMFYTNRQGSPGDHISLDGRVHEGEEVNYKPHKSYRTHVPTAPLDDVVGQRRVYFLKVDVQGHELFVFEGAQRMFRERRVGYALFEFQPKQLGPNAASLIERLNGFGYDTFSLMPWWSRGDGFSDEFYSFPTDPRAFAAAFRPTHANGMGEWTDILAVCRTCVSDNHAAPSRFMQRFDPGVLAAFADKVTSDGGGAVPSGEPAGPPPPRGEGPVPQPPDLPPRKPPVKPPQLPVDEADGPRPDATPEMLEHPGSRAPPKRPINAPIPHVSSVGGYAEAPTPGPPGSQVSGPKPGRAALPLPLRRPGYVQGKAGAAGVVIRRRTPLPSPQGTGADAPAAPLPAADDGDPEVPPATDEVTSTEAPTTTTPPTTFAEQPAETQPDPAND
jgi:FkbM family methyltransferase